jgi:hypothetical protein
MINYCIADTENLSIGGFYAFILGRNENVELSVVARSNYDAVEKHVRPSCPVNVRGAVQLIDEQGLKIESENHGNHTVNISHGKPID